jgi:hypothetical protein
VDSRRGRDRVESLMSCCFSKKMVFVYGRSGACLYSGLLIEHGRSMESTTSNIQGCTTWDAHPLFSLGLCSFLHKPSGLIIGNRYGNWPVPYHNILNGLSLRGNRRIDDWREVQF